MKSRAMPTEGSAREERMETHEQEMQEQAQKQEDWDKLVDPTLTNSPANKGSSKD